MTVKEINQKSNDRWRKMYLSEIKRMLLKVNDVKTMHFIYVIIKDALKDSGD